MPVTWGKGSGHLSKGQLLPALPPRHTKNQAGSESFYGQCVCVRGAWGVGGYMQKERSHLSQPSSTGLQWSDQHRLGCFRCSYSSLPGCTYSCFFAVDSWNCGSSRPGYSPIIMWLTSPPGVLVSIRQLTGYGSEYYLQPLRES